MYCLFYDYSIDLVMYRQRRGKVIKEENRSSNQGSSEHVTQIMMILLWVDQLVDARGWRKGRDTKLGMLFCMSVSTAGFLSTGSSPAEDANSCPPDKD
jgi:hypothetical protein